MAWHEASSRWLTFTHGAASAVLRHRSLGRVWVDHEPADRMEPFNLLHRHQMMENEPPDHTRLRRAVASAFSRGHVERLRPRVEVIAHELLDGALAAGRTSFDAVVDYAEPLPVLMIAELLGIPASWAPDLRRWSQSIVAMYEPAVSESVRAAAVDAAVDFAQAVAELVTARRRRPAEDLLSHLAVGSGLDDREVVASTVLLLNAGHEASTNALGNGLVSMFGQEQRPGSGEEEAYVEEMLRHDAPLQLFERTAVADVAVGGATIAAGEKVAALLGAAHRDPAVCEEPDTFWPGRRSSPHLAFGVGIHHCVGSPLARLELTTALRVLCERHPALRPAGDPVRRQGFVLRGHASVPVTV